MLSRLYLHAFKRSRVSGLDLFLLFFLCRLEMINSVMLFTFYSSSSELNNYHDYQTTGPVVTLPVFLHTCG